tara:strand:- start:1260 stop:1550 length:291 start_codon:yes stop_codon:yes gene_type:complete
MLINDIINDKIKDKNNVTNNDFEIGPNHEQLNCFGVPLGYILDFDDEIDYKIGGHISPQIIEKGYIDDKLFNSLFDKVTLGSVSKKNRTTRKLKRK